MLTSVPIPADLPATALETTAERPWPLRLLSAKMKEYIARMSGIWIEGEVIQFVVRPNAKTQFFTVKDLEEDVSITVSIYTHALPPNLESGNRVVVYAKPSFWEKRGTLNLWATEIRHVGLGDILARIEELKNRLAAEGLFDEALKKPLPFLPRRIGLVAGRNAEGTRDVLVNARRRLPGADFEVREVAVQGAAAVREILPALAELDAMEDVDVIVIARGGGSLEDLLPFSDEQLVRAVAATRTPVVSAIGHERDVPLLDLVADVRASTPTDAARRIVPDIREELARIDNDRARLRAALGGRIERAQADLEALRSRPALASPTAALDVRRQDIAQLRAWLHTHLERRIEADEAKLAGSVRTLRALSPQSTLERGYSILMDKSGSVVSRSAQAAGGDRLAAVLADGRLDMTVNETTQGNPDAR